VDCVCLSRYDTESDLLCLPFFVGGCKQFVVLAGPTWSSRLWCLVEAFVFLQLGSSDALVVRGTQSPETLRCSAAKAMCTLASDRDGLLGAIESAFGTLTAFDAAVNQALLQAANRQGPETSHAA